MTAARGFEYYGQSTPIAPTVTAAAPPVQPARPQATATATQVPTAKRNSARLLCGSAYLLTFAGLSLLAAFLVTVTPLGAIDLDVTQPFLATVAVAVMLTIIAVARV